MTVAAHRSELIRRSTGHPVLALIGPSAAGKSAVAAELHRRGVIVLHPTWTTRPRRQDESGARLDHRFMCDEEFDDLCARGFFAGTGRLPGLPYRYGLPPLAQSAGTALGAVILRARYLDGLAAAGPRLLVYQVVDRLDRTSARLRSRNCASTEIDSRRAEHHRELTIGRHRSHRCFVNDQTLAALADAMTVALRTDAHTEPVGAHS